MQCPKCKQPITKLVKKCGNCKYAIDDALYEKLSVFFNLRDELNNLNHVKEVLAKGIDSVQFKFKKYEEQLNTELGADISDAQLPEEVSKPVVKTKTESVTPPVTEVAKTGSTTPPPQAHTPQPASSSQSFKKKYSALIPGMSSSQATSQERRAAPVSKTPETKATPPAIAKAETKTEDNSSFELMVGQKLLLAAGILLVVFGTAFFLKYAFDKGWIGPAGRVALAYIWGASFLIGGDQLRKRLNETYGLALTGGGIAVLYFATTAAFQKYHLFGQTTSFAIMVVITALAVALALRYDTIWLAVLALVGGFLTPILVSTGTDNQMALMTYMIILNLGMLAISFYKDWKLLSVFGFIFTYILYVGWFSKFYTDEKFWRSIIFLNIFYLIYSVTPFAHLLNAKDSQTDDKQSMGASLLNTCIAFGFSYSMITRIYPNIWVSVLTVLYAAMFLAMARYLYRKNLQTRYSFIMLIAKSLFFLIITVPFLFSKHWITILWAAQTIGLVWAGAKLGSKRLVICSYLLFVIVVVKFLFYDYWAIFKLSSSFYIKEAYTHLLPERVVTTIIILLLIYATAFIAKKHRFQVINIDTRNRNDSAVFFAMFTLMLFIVLNIEVAAFFFEYYLSARFVAITVLWTAYAAALMAFGFSRSSAQMRSASLALFLATLLKVVFLDMSRFSTPYRIVSFIILGLVMLAASYLYYSHKEKIKSVFTTDTDTEDV